ncbi:MAG: DUF63 family protein [Archaeoglobaceae archaeon]|nr:DUF63 family protein [Archaeoglobaceae archaeon]
MSVWDFIKKYYVDSIVYKQGYNAVNTVTWAAILIVAVILIYKYLSKRIKFDEKFVFANVPFIILGSSVRIVEDAGFLKPPISYFFMTPLIYIIIFSIAFPSLIISLRMKEDYWKYYGLVGLIASLSVIILLIFNLKIVNWWVFPIAISLSSILTTLFYFLTKLNIFSKMGNALSYTAFFSHMLDGCATFLGINYLGYWELHVLPRFLIENFGAWIMIPTKFLVFFAVLFVLDTEKDENLKNFLKFVLIVLGMAPGVRDALRMTFAV